MFLPSAKSIAQSDSLKIDSLKRILGSYKQDTTRVNILNELTRLIEKTIFTKGDAINNFDLPELPQAYTYSNEAIILAHKLSFPKGEEKAYSCLGLYYAFKSNNSAYINSLREAQKISMTLNENDHTSDYYIKIGEAYRNVGRDAEALKELLSGLRIMEDTHNYFGMAYATWLVAIIYTNQEKYAEALSYSRQCLNLSQSLRLGNYIAPASNVLGDVYYHTGDYDSALKYHSAAIKIWHDSSSVNSSGYNWIGAASYGTIGNIYEKQAQLYQNLGIQSKAKESYKTALENYLVSLSEFKKINRTDGMSQAYTNLVTSIVSRVKQIRQDIILKKV
ncbi:MAG: tetratricopeptide repeat protein [Bacteroidota bacterium]